MDFIDKQHIAFFQGSQQACQVAGLVENRAGRDLEVDTEFRRHDMGQRSLSQARRAVKEDMVECLTPQKRRFHEDFEVFEHLFLSGELVEVLRTDYLVEFTLPERGLRTGIESFSHNSTNVVNNTKLIK